ncbi:MAG: hypothetical protein H0U48_03335 [Euzebyaceae bacterium]|jgi:hypothetical protein|nr:hypothetical protein [Euzebyaceae bacterium]
MRLTTLAIWMVALLLTACAGGTGAGDPPAPGGGQAGAEPTDEPTGEPTVARPSVDPSELREQVRGRKSRTLTGRLGRDETLEGGCAWLEAEGQRWQVIYPRGYRLDIASGALFGPDGKIADDGDTVTVQGAAAPDMATTCQVGPVFRATSVEV